MQTVIVGSAVFFMGCRMLWSLEGTNKAWKYVVKNSGHGAVLDKRKTVSIDGKK